MIQLPWTKPNMSIKQQQLKEAVDKNIISEEQANQLALLFKKNGQDSPTFDFTHCLYYLGGMIAIGAMSLFMNLGWENFGGWGIFFISIAYMIVGIVLTNLFQQKSLNIPAGITAAFIVVMTPLAIYGLQHALGLWPDDTVYKNYHTYIQWHWLLMELASLMVGALVIWHYRYPFIIMPIAVTLWYLSMDLAAFLAQGHPSLEFRAFVSLYFGLAMILFALWVDIRSRKTLDYAFWLYLFGVMAFWGGMTAQNSNSELSKFIYFTINIIMLGVGTLLIRRVFVVFGAIGCTLYLSHLASLFAKNWLFPIVLSAIGFFIIYLGIKWQKHQVMITEKLRSLLPEKLRLQLDKM